MEDWSAAAVTAPSPSSERAPQRFVPLSSPPSAIGLATHVRSTLIATSLQSLRRRGLLESYAKLLRGKHKDIALTTVAGSWMSIDTAAAHYRACDALGLDPPEQLALGMEVGDRVHGTFLGVMVRAARTAGVTPWVALAQSAKLHGRLFCGGGGISVKQLGPKDARIDMLGNALCDIDYFRVGVRGVYQAAVQLFCTKAYTMDASLSRAARSMAIRVSWA